jgi:hypothetical protein
MSAGTCAVLTPPASLHAIHCPSADQLVEVGEVSAVLCVGIVHPSVMSPFCGAPLKVANLRTY